MGSRYVQRLLAALEPHLITKVELASIEQLEDKVCAGFYLFAMKSEARRPGLSLSLRVHSAI
jgi:hypothetical protein